jgi:ABC-2 type transport system permease protein
VLLGARWGHPLAVLLLIVAAVLAAMGITTLVVTAAKTEEQAGGYASAVGVVLALLGGNFIPISSAPAVLRRLTLLTPNGWALRGFTDLGTGARASAIVPSLVALSLFAVVTGGVAVARAGRVVHAR